MENFSKRKKAYLKRLTQYADIIMKLLCNNETIREAAVLMEPRTPLELDFAISTLDYVDDMDKLLNHITLGHIEDINPEESLFVDYIAKLLSMIDNTIDVEYIEKEMDKFRKDLIQDEEEFLANLKYEFTVFSFTDPKEILAAIAKKSGANINDQYTILKLNFAYDMLQKDIIKETGEKDYAKIIKFNKKFHERCEKGLNKYTSNVIDELIEEILGPDNSDTNRVYRK